jgi:hypothetical protein
MRQDPFSFEPTHELWLLGNHKPEVGTGGFAFWRRMRLIPFERVVPDDCKIDNLADLLVMEEGPGILAWLIDGARRYRGGDRDLTGPERVRIATTAYAEAEDHTGRFYDECCRLGPDLRSEQTALYAAYTAWCHKEGAQIISSRAFASPDQGTGRTGLTQGDESVQPAQVLPGHRTAHRRGEGLRRMSSLISADEISHEAELVWLEDIGALDYVRQSLDRLPTRNGKPAYHRDGHMAGYAILGPDAKASRASGTFRRRVFWLLPHDRDTEPDGLYAKSAPAEAVDPRTLLRAFFMGISPELTESARIDGASDLRILLTIIIPLFRAVLAVISLFYAVGYWSAWFNASICLTDQQMMPLQNVLIQLVQKNTEAPTGLQQAVRTGQLSALGLQMAVMVLALIPVAVASPFVQRHFKKGMLTGAIKG